MAKVQIVEDVASSEDEEEKGNHDRRMSQSITLPALASKYETGDSLDVDTPTKSKSVPAFLYSRRPIQTFIPLGRIDSYQDPSHTFVFFGDSDDSEPHLDSVAWKSVAWLAIAILLTMCANAGTFEILNKVDHGCTDLIFFAQVAYAALECLFGGAVKAFVFERQVPIIYHIINLVFERGRIALYNGALNYGLPMPVYLVLKNSGLVVSMALGWSVQRKTYGFIQVLGVLAITGGVIVSTFASRPAGKEPSTSSAIDIGQFVPATLLMFGGVIVTALMNIVQERAFSEYGKHFQETMFYSNVLMLPLLLLDFSSIISHSHTWMSMWMPLPLASPLDVAVPYMWLLLLVNMLAASIMKLSCMRLTAAGGQLSNVVAVTVARFVCVAVSAVGFNSPPFPSVLFWLGGGLVLGGTLAYALAVPSSKPSVKKE